MIFYGLSTVVWCINTLFGNRGAEIQLVFWRLSQVFLIVPIITVIMTVVATNSYGNQANVYTSWSGSPTYTSTISTTRDNKYLMWTDVSAVVPANGIFTL